MKTCIACKEAKPLDQFSNEKKSADGKHSYCKACSSAKHKKLYAERGRASWLYEKTCPWCRTLKSRSEFAAKPGGGHRSRCRACETEITAKTAEGRKRCNLCYEWLPLGNFNPSKRAVANAPCAKCYRAQMSSYKDTRRVYILKTQYGITLDQYKALLKHQNGRCPICTEAFEPGVYTYPIDHAHTGKFRGRIRAIVHDLCNSMVLSYHDDARQLRAAADLIENPLTNWVVPEAKTIMRARKNGSSDRS